MPVSKSQNHQGKLLIYAAYLGIGVGLTASAYYFALKLGFVIVGLFIPGAPNPIHPNDFRYAWLVTTIGGFLVGLLIHYWGKPSNLNEVVDEIHKQGRIDYSKILVMLITSLVSLSCGASVGPESPLIDIYGGVGSWLGDKLKLPKEKLRILTFCGMGAALGAFFGSPLGSAILALEVSHCNSIEYYEAIIPVIISSIISFIIFCLITGTTIGGEYVFPSYPELHSIDILYAALLGIIGAVVAILFIIVFRATAYLTRLLSHKPILLNTLGGLAIGLIAMVFPLTLFYGEDQIQTIINTGSELGVGVLLLTALVKMFTMALSVHSGFRGGFIFILLFIGASVGMAISLLFPAIPTTVAIIALMASVTVAVMKIPISVVLILSVISHTELIPLITISTMVSFLLTRPITFVSTQRSRSAR